MILCERGRANEPFSILHHCFQHKVVHKYHVECHPWWTDSDLLESCVEDRRLVPGWQEKHAEREEWYLSQVQASSVSDLFVSNNLNDLWDVEGWQMSPTCTYSLPTDHRQGRREETKVLGGMSHVQVILAEKESTRLVLSLKILSSSQRFPGVTWMWPSQGLQVTQWHLIRTVDSHTASSWQVEMSFPTSWDSGDTETLALFDVFSMT